MNSENTNKISALIVDDETLARTRIARLLESEPDIRIIGEAKNGREALRSIKKHKPDLVFLDIQMPIYDGFETLSKILPEDTPEIIFVTAYDQYALSAFDVNAIDYLLKPFDKARFQKALKRARKRINKGITQSANLNSLREAVSENPSGIQTDRLAIRDGAKVTIVRLAEIQWIEAAQNYLKIHTTKEEFLMRSTLKELAERLDPNSFVRIHRSTIVNIDFVRDISPWFHGDQIVRLRSGVKLTLARTRRAELARLIGE